VSAMVAVKKVTQKRNRDFMAKRRNLPHHLGFLYLANRLGLIGTWCLASMGIVSPPHCGVWGLPIALNVITRYAPVDRKGHALSLDRAASTCDGMNAESCPLPRLDSQFATVCMTWQCSGNIEASRLSGRKRYKASPPCRQRNSITCTHTTEMSD
jgi:hypothetical protein